MRRATGPGPARLAPRFNFYPRSPCGERRIHYDNYNLHCVISIHALLAESDLIIMLYNTSSLIFLSTLSLRRATGRTAKQTTYFFYFYPRSPCGERPWGCSACYLDNIISIHALLAESDQVCICMVYYNCKFLSTLSLRRATVTVLGIQHRVGISIHALLAESDGIMVFCGPQGSGFLSTLSLRRATGFVAGNWRPVIFLSTLSLRRATTWARGSRVTYVISIHALLAESDRQIK